MFVNLKNKLIEEVKASPSKFQQFAAAVSSSASTTPSGSESTTTTNTNENFFSITEEDTPQNSPYKPLKLPPGAVSGRINHNGPASMSGGAVARTRKLSNSSIASDVSFRLPSYESPPMYHIQSDLESNCSELEDTASTAKLDVISKDQLFDAYKKSLDRYHKYRSRYTDLAKKYKDLERDSTKARSVLVETQEKAIRRISELREQCSLEQQAKSHLEEALRMEMDDMQCQMQAYQTKLKLLEESPNNVAAVLSTSASNGASGGASLIDLDDTNNSSILVSQEESIDKNLIYNLEVVNFEKDAPKLTQLQKELEQRQCKIDELTASMLKAEETIEQLRKQEEDNALLLAQTKQAIHSELENKESEVKKLTEKVTEIQKELQETTKKEKQFSGQTNELKDLRDKFKKLQVSKQETDAKLIAAEHMLGQLKEHQTTNVNAVEAAEEKLEKAIKDSEHKLDELRQHNAQLNEMVQRYQQNEVSLAEIDNELNRTKNDNDILKSTIADHEQKIYELDTQVRTQKDQLERHEKERSAEKERCKEMMVRDEELSQKLQEAQGERELQTQIVKQLQSELNILNERNSDNENETIAALKVELHKVNVEMVEQVRVLKEQLASKEKELKTNTNKLGKQKKQFESQQNCIREQKDEIEMFRGELSKHEDHLSSLQSESRAREECAEAEKAKLKGQIQKMLQDIAQMQDEMIVVKKSHDELEAEKLKLEQRIGDIQQETQNASDSTQLWREQLTDVEEKLRQVETKLQNVESENSQLAERNCLLEEQNNRLEKQLVERERQKETEEANANELRVKLDTAQTAIHNLNEKMSQVLDENTRMHNTQELMDHDYRTLQDKLDALEKEKLIAEDTQTILQEELDQLRERKIILETRLRETVEQLQQVEEKCAEEKKNSEAYEAELKEMTNATKHLERENLSLSAELNELKAAQSDDEKMQSLMREQKRRIELLERELVAKEEATRAGLEFASEENRKLREDLDEKNATLGKLGQTKEECEQLKAQTAELNQELIVVKEELQHSRKSCKELEKQAVQLEVLMQEKEENQRELKAFKEEIEKLEEETRVFRAEAQNKETELETLRQQIQSANAINDKLGYTEGELLRLQETERNARAESAASVDLANQRICELEEQLRTANSDIDRLHESNDAIQVEMDKLQNNNEMQAQTLKATLKQLREDNEKLEKQVGNEKVNVDKLANFEQLHIENEYLNKHVKQLETELAEQRADASVQLKEGQELHEKLKSLQCELYVLRENAEKHDAQLADKQKAIDSANNECQEIREKLANEHTEFERQLVHAKYITEQNDAIQSDLLNKQHQLTEVEQQLHDIKVELGEVKSTYAKDIATKTEEANLLNIKLQQATSELDLKTQLEKELDALRVELAEHYSFQEVSLAPVNVERCQKSAAASDVENLRHINEALQRELEDLKHKSSAEITELQQEIEDMQSNAKHTAIQPLQTPNAWAAEDLSGTKQQELLQREKAELSAKLREIMNEVRDVSERNLFLEQQCENYLILEQSNERLKLQNSKLSRQLDETLVSMQHNEGITANTEFEYLKNIMFQYLTGSANGNNETLVKVISAVLKFSPQQTQVALEKEHQRRSLINKIL